MTPEGLTALADVERPSNPFPGLRPFEFGESHLYFGRDGQSDQLIRKLAATRFVAVVGTSGSGKSSLVRAGLLPDLYGGFMPSAGTRWRVCLIRPSNDPLGNLARALNVTSVFGSEIEENAQIQTAITEATLRRGGLGLVEVVRQNRMPRNESLLVVVDQFEELFRFARVSASEQYRYEAAAFVKLLLEAARQREHNVYVVLTMRSDFLGDCSIFWDLPEAVNEGQYLIPRMTRDQRTEAITGPVAVGGGRVTQRLVNRLLNDTGDNPDLLPILQHALMRSWENWAGDHAGDEPVDLRHYEAVGTMTDALSRHADEAFNELSDERRQLIAERVFKALTERGEDNREVRRPTVLGELCAQVVATPPEVVEVVEVFRREGRSFLMPPASVPLDEESLIDISHESLIRNWQRLKEWVDEESVSAQIYHRLAETAVLHEQGQAGLWRDPDLQVALDWRERTHPTAAWAARYHTAFDTAISFLDASVNARDDAALEDEQRRRREMRRTRRAAVVFFLLFVLALAFFGYAYYKSVEANNARSSAEAAATRNRQLLYAADMNLAQQSYDVGNLSRARELLDAHAPGGTDTPGFEWYYLRRFLHDETDTLTIELNGGHTLQSTALTADGQTLFVDKGDGVEFWDVASRQKLRSIDKQPTITATDISPDGRLLAFGGAGSSAVTLIDAATGKELQKLGGEGDTQSTEGMNEPGVSIVRFSPDGNMLAVGTELGGAGSPEVVVWNVASRQRQAVFRGVSTINSVAFSPDGRTVAASELGGVAWLRNLNTGRVLCSFLRSGENLISVTYTHDGQMLAAIGNDGKVYIWRTGQCGLVQTKVSLEIAGSSTVGSFDFSPDDGLLAVGYTDRSIKIFGGFDFQTEVAAFKGHGRYINSVAFLPDKRTLITAGEDGTIKLWDTSQRLLEHEPLRVDGAVFAVAFSPDGRTLATSDSSQQIRLWDAGTRQPMAMFAQVRGGLTHEVAFSPDGRTLAVSSDGEGTPSISLRDVNAFEQSAPFDIKDDKVYSVAFSPDGRRLVSGGSKLRVWDAASRALLKEFEEPADMVAFSRDGRMFAAARFHGGVKLWDGALTKALKSFDTQKITSLAFSPDGRVLAVASELGSVKLWDTAAAAELATLSGHNGAVYAVTFSPDGRTLATGGEDASVKLWSTSSFKELVTINGHTSAVTALAFSPDGRTLASGSYDRMVRLWLAAGNDEVKASAPR